MNQISALLVVAVVLLAGGAGIAEAARAMARARIRRQQRLLRLSSVVTGLPPSSPDSFSQS